MIPERIYRQIYALTIKSPIEISGFGRTKITEDEIIVKELRIFKQKNHAVHTSLSGDDLTQMYVETAQEGGKPEKWNFWWHSHVNMSTDFSNTDVDTLETLTKNGGQIIALCTNKQGHYSATYYKNEKCIIKNLVLHIIPAISNEDLYEAKQIIRRQVEEDNTIFILPEYVDG